ncbi:microtubule-destabilizing protein 60-like isoform X2 [Musa acuminata AAA Group]|uniref:microtubule-destabilizing protein 60-like isoform X2 n=1 Tax=Musa acuminata AAA Group TaxID=214697 RepID=UPI0031D08CBE
MTTPVKKYRAPRCYLSENIDPNVAASTPPRSIRSPTILSAKTKKSVPKMSSSPSLANAKRTAAGEKDSVKGNRDFKSTKRRQVASDGLGTPQEKPFARIQADGTEKMKKNREEIWCSLAEEPGTGELEGSSKMRMMRRMMLEEAMSSLPEPGAGRVMYLVKTFERLFSISKETKGDGGGQSKRKVMTWALPALQLPTKVDVTGVSCSPVASYSSSFHGEDDDGDSTMQSSVNSNGDRWNSESDGRANRCNRTGSPGSSLNKKPKVTHQPLKLRTEQRGRCKEENFTKKIRGVLLEEEKRKPFTQRLTWNMEEPEAAEHVDFIKQAMLERERQDKVYDLNSEDLRIASEHKFKDQDKEIGRIRIQKRYSTVRPAHAVL